MKNLRPSGVLLAIAHGSESLETVTLINVLRRAEIEVVVASIESELTVTGTRGIKLTADARFLDAREHRYEMIVLPGGEKGADALSRHMPLIEMLEQQNHARRTIAAICAAPALTLAPHHFLVGRRATCHPAFKDRLDPWIDEPVVIDGHLATSQGPATALPFALKLAELLAGAVQRNGVAAAMLTH
ncbi:MAG: protein deglycase YajL [Nevskia sp.]